MSTIFFDTESNKIEVSMGVGQLKNAVEALTNMLATMKRTPDGDYSYWEEKKPNELILPAVTDVQYSDLCILCLHIQNQINGKGN